MHLRINITPDNEYIHWWNTTYSEFLTYIQKEQTRASYIDLWNNPANPHDGSMDGNLYEREPMFLLW